MKKALFVGTIVNFFHFELNDIKILQEKGYQVEVAAHVCEYDGYLDDIGVKVYDIPFARSPFSKDNIKAYRELKKLISSGNYDIVHCHTPVGGVLTRLVNFFHHRDYHLIYTAHGFHFYKGAPLLNWLIYYPVEWFLSFKTDSLVTITKEDYARAKKHMHAKTIHYIPGVGVNVDKLSHSNVSEEDKIRLRGELGVPLDSFLVLSIGELNENKNHKTAIKAIAELKNDNIFYIIAGKGPLHNELEKLIIELGVSDKVKLLGYRHDVPVLLKICDLYLHPSFREGLSVSIMEAMSIGKPVLCSKIRGNVDLIENINNFEPYINPLDPISISSKVKELCVNDSIRFDLAKINSNNIGQFDYQIVEDIMTDVYSL